MAAAIRAVSVERGIDPRRFTLVAGGGAGGAARRALARELGIARDRDPARGRHALRHQELPVEILHWRVTAIGRTATAAASAGVAAGNGAAPGSRAGYFDGAWVAMAIHDGAALRPGATVAGPAVIESATTTILVPPGDRLTVADSGNYTITVGTA